MLDIEDTPDVSTKYDLKIMSIDFLSKFTAISPR